MKKKKINYIGSEEYKMTAQELIDEVLSESWHHCVTCGSAVRIYSGKEGTNSYIPLTEKLARMLKVAIEEITNLTFMNEATQLKWTSNVMAELDRIAQEGE